VARSLAILHEFWLLVWGIKIGFGGRIIPTKAQKGALSASFSGPVGVIEPSPFFDEDAEAEKLKHMEEVREETELTEMSLHDFKVCV
jgi:hypothetical protein